MAPTDPTIPNRPNFGKFGDQTCFRYETEIRKPFHSVTYGYGDYDLRVLKSFKRACRYVFNAATISQKAA
jgi:hypothetical protein